MERIEVILSIRVSYLIFVLLLLVTRLSQEFDIGGRREHGKAVEHAAELATRFTTRATTRPRTRRPTTTPPVSFYDGCDYLAIYCLKAHTTGKVCGRSLYYTYFTFVNYCQLYYVNCMERYEVWQVSSMGDCFIPAVFNQSVDYPYTNDSFLDDYTVTPDLKLQQV